MGDWIIAWQMSFHDINYMRMIWVINNSRDANLSE